MGLAFYLSAVGGVGVALASLVYWWLVVGVGEDRFRAAVERRYGVTIGRSFRGHWSSAGPGSKAHHFAIELLQLAYFTGAVVVWSVAISVAVLGLGWIQSLPLGT